MVWRVHPAILAIQAGINHMCLMLKIPLLFTAVLAVVSRNAYRSNTRPDV